jgi:dTDP-4-dehydrorhamnose reductase
MVILVTGGEGQLASCFKSSHKLIDNKWIFLSKKELDITNTDNVGEVFEKYEPDVIINCAAYTNVEKAEENKETAKLVNAIGPKVLAQCARHYNAKLIHISTDYVFSGESPLPYLYDDRTRPLSYYGRSKLEGENIIKNYDNVYIFRTSWLYSEYCHNFFKTMYNRIKNGEKTFVVNDQIGTPTYARDLANFIIHIIENNTLEKAKSHILHFSNEGCCSWYDFAKSIEIEYNRFDGGESLSSNIINPISTFDYRIMLGRDIAERPFNSVLDNEGIETIYKKPIRHWLEAMNECYIRNRNVSE